MPAGNVTVTVAFKEKDFTDCQGITVKFSLRDNSTDSLIPICILVNGEAYLDLPYTEFVSLLGTVKYTNIKNLTLFENDSTNHTYIIDNTNGTYTVDSVDLSNNILSIIVKPVSSI
jgi:hypothetical protein